MVKLKGEIMHITTENYEEAFNLSKQRLEAYIASQITPKQISDAKHHLHHLEINKNYLRGRIDKGGIYFCSRCGILEAANYSTTTKDRMTSKQICFHCDHWEQISKEVKPSRLIIDGETYGDGGNKPKERKDFLGFGGRLWKIEREGKIWETNNIWYGGVIPQEYRDIMPDNARFVIS